MTPTERDNHNRGIMVQCNGLGWYGRSRDGLPMRRRELAGGESVIFYDPSGLKVVPPDRFEAKTLDELVAYMAETNSVCCQQLALVR
jgi:hypothetical protein